MKNEYEDSRQSLIFSRACMGGYLYEPSMRTIGMCHFTVNELFTEKFNLTVLSTVIGQYLIWNPVDFKS